jgi:cobalt/nickel transport system permease protein
MKHDFIDKYSTLDSPFHRLDPRLKLLLSFLFLILVAATNNIKLFGLYLVVVIISMISSKVPADFYIKKLLLVTPLAVLLSIFIFISYILQYNLPLSLATLSTYHPVYLTLGLMVSKIYISILAITLLISTTRFNDLLWGLRKFRLPYVVTTLSKLVYTYIFVFVDELHRTLRAYKSRTPVRRISRVKVYGNIAAAILLRSIDRSDYIYKAMVSRGFDGEFPEGNTNRLKLNDLCAAVVFLIIAAAAMLLWKV